jgi:CAAX protease family protein
MVTPPAPLPDGELLPPQSATLEAPPPPAPVKDPPWTIWDVVILVAITLAAMFLVQATAVAITMAMRPGVSIKQMATAPYIIIPAQFVSYALVLAAMVYLLRSRGLRFWRAIRWEWPRTWPLLLGGGMVLSLLVQLASVFLPIPKQLPIEEFFRETQAVYMLAVFGITLAPLMEELFFRGFLYPVLARSVGMTAAVLLTTVLFASIHAPQLARAWAPLLLLFTVGLILTLLRAKTGSVATSFLVHVGYNFGLFAALWIATDHFRNLEKMSR